MTLLKDSRRYQLSILWLATLNANVFVPTASAKTPTLTRCQTLVPQIGGVEFRKWYIRRADQSPPGSLAERRPKIINGNFRPIGVGADLMESADPTRPMKDVGPDGKEFYRIDASGTDSFRADSLNDLLRGGVQSRERVRVVRRYADGTVTKGPYHTGGLGWDGLVAKFPIKDETGKTTGYQKVGYLGMMEQPYKMLGAAEAGITSKRPIVGQHNPSRTRHALDITYDEKGREIWTSRGSISESKPSIAGEWMSDVHEHGYGGRPLMDADGVVMEHDGSPWMIYERVTEEKVHNHPDGRVTRDPWITEVYARRMKDPYTLYKKGETLPDGRPADEIVKIVSVTPPATKKYPNPAPYPATDRKGIGYLAEGFNIAPTVQTINGKKYWVGTGSTGNYVDKNYGINLGFRKFEDGPIGLYTWATDSKGDIKNFAEKFINDYDVTWFGRGDIFPDEQGKLWMIAHGVEEDNLPEGFPKEGWVRPDQFEYYFRKQFLIPIELSERNGMVGMDFVDPYSKPKREKSPKVLREAAAVQ